MVGSSPCQSETVEVSQGVIKKRKDNIMKKVKNIFHKIANADPMIWGYVMLNETK